MVGMGTPHDSGDAASAGGGTSVESEVLLPLETPPDSNTAAGRGFSRTRGLGVATSAWFITLVSIFTISMPYAMAQTGLFGGVMFIVVVPLIMLYLAVLLGRCWTLLMEKYPEQYRDERVRRPYAAVAKEAGGRFWYYFTRTSVDVNNFGAGIVLLLAAASSLQILFPGQFTDRVWMALCGLVVTPFICFGTPMDSWFVAWLGGIATVLTTMGILTVVVMSNVWEHHHDDGSVQFANLTMPLNTSTGTWMPVSVTPQMHATQSAASVGLFLADDDSVSFTSFWVGASVIVFSFAATGIIPSIQHDMKSPRHLSHAMVPPYITAILLSLATAIVGVETFGSLAHPNILRSAQCLDSHAIRIMNKIVAALFTAFVEFAAFLNFLPFTQSVEDFFKLTTVGVNYKHILVRCTTVVFALAAGLAVPHFQKYSALVGASAMSLNCFVFPPLYYYWLMKAHGVSLHRAQVAFLSMALVLGVVIALVGTFTAVRAIIVDSLPRPC